MAKPFFRWMGGKSRLVDQLLSSLPPHKCYVEVFAGGGALFFAKPPVAAEVINDTDGELVNLYRVVRNHGQEFARQFDWALSSRADFAMHSASAKAAQAASEAAENKNGGGAN